ncbi:hypothetical protein NDU88_003173 [Pleurodeles waltl]|uniref:Uncharacterized protein n=1 Tax=Pleurodeles waltl TaxID=8319 RepID=A0AAV7MUV7_PLEWA|nr:hypothetical protein NDU88_003173 [Pleurodeles waltl]
MRYGQPGCSDVRRNREGQRRMSGPLRSQTWSREFRSGTVLCSEWQRSLAWALLQFGHSGLCVLRRRQLSCHLAVRPGRS